MKKFSVVALIAFFVLLAGINPALLNADQVTVAATVDKKTVSQDEEVSLNIKISGVSGNIPAPRLPSFQAFDSFYSGRASHFTFINGKSESLVSFNYVLVPKSTGAFQIQPIEVVVDGKIYKTEPIQIEVLTHSAAPPMQAPPVAPIANPSPAQHQQPVSYSASPATPAYPSAPAVSSGGDENIFLRVVPSKYEVYTNEQLLLVYSLLTRYDTRYEGFEEEPETSGFWIEDFPMDKDIGKQTETVNGRKYVRADIKKSALFPTAPGEYVIKPGTIKASVQIQQRSNSFLDEFFNDSFFSGSGVFARRVDKLLTVPPIKITVKPIPEAGKPKSFNGAVGDFRIASSVDKRVINQNEPVTLRLVIEGQGNIETLARPPIPEMQDVKIYDSDTKSEFFKAQDLIAGKKTFEIIFIPRLAGSLAIPAVEFSFFNPRTGGYQTLTTERYEITVNQSFAPVPETPRELLDVTEKNKQEIKTEGREIRYIHERLAPSRTWLNSYLTAVGGLGGLFTLAGLILIGMRRNEAFLDSNTGLKRSRYALRNAAQQLKKLKNLMSKQGGKSQQRFFDDAERLMNQYLADKLNLSPQALTQNLIAEKLSERGISEEIIQKIRRFYDDCGMIRFAPPGSFSARSHEILGAIESILREKI